MNILSLVLQRIIRGWPAGLMCKRAFLQDWKFRHSLVRTRVESFPHASVYLTSNLAPLPSGLTNNTLSCISFISLNFLQEPPKWCLCFQLMLHQSQLPKVLTLGLPVHSTTMPSSCPQDKAQLLEDGLWSFSWSSIYLPSQSHISLFSSLLSSLTDPCLISPIP